MSATTFLRRRNYAGDTCKNEEFPAATFGKKVCIFRYLGVAKNSNEYNFAIGDIAYIRSEYYLNATAYLECLICKLCDTEGIGICGENDTLEIIN